MLLLASVARAVQTTPYRSDVQQNDPPVPYKGLRLDIDITAVPGAAPAVVFTIEAYDEVAAVYSTILASASLTGTGHTTLVVHPELTASANAIAKDVIPQRWEVKAVHGNTNSVTYSVEASPLY